MINNNKEKEKIFLNSYFEEIDFEFFFILLIVPILFSFGIFYFNNFKLSKNFINEKFLQFLIFLIILAISLKFNFNVILKIFKINHKSDEIKQWGIKIKNKDFSFLRGRNYYLGSPASKDILISNYNLGHFIQYCISGILCPDLYLLMIIIGIWWELLESTENVDCFDFSDIFYNISGMVFGIFLRKKIEALKKKKKKENNEFK